MKPVRTADEAAAAVGDAIRRGEIEADLGHSAIGAVAAWTAGSNAATALMFGGAPADTTPSQLYDLAGTQDELRQFSAVLATVGLQAPWKCPDCAAQVGDLHQDGCDVGRCPACGTQALGCEEHPESGTQRWTGRWPGEVEVEQGLASDLNDLALKGATGELVWNTTTQLWAPPA